MSEAQILLSGLVAMMLMTCGVAGLGVGGGGDWRGQFERALAGVGVTHAVDIAEILRQTQLG